MTQTMMPVQTVTQAQPQYVITDEDKARQKQIEAAWKAYHGELPAPLQKMPDSPDDNVLSNRCQPIVDHGVDFLFGKPLGIQCKEGAPPDAQTLLEDTWGENEARNPLLQRLAMDGAIAGCAFLRIVPHKDSTYRLVVIDPSIVYVKTAPQDLDTVLLYCLEYSTPEVINGRNVTVFYREEIARVDPVDDSNPASDEDAEQSGDITWSIQHWTRIGDRQPWTAAGEPIDWSYPFAPVFTCQNLPYPRSFWGMPDLPVSLIGMNNALNLTQSLINRLNKLYGGPILYATGVDFASRNVEQGRIMGLPTSESKIAAVSLTSDMANALVFADSLRSNMDEQSAVPAVVLGRIAALPRGAISGVTMELMFMPLTQKTEKKRSLYGKLIIDVSSALLVLARFSPDIKATLQWQDPLPNDDLASVQAALAKQQLGVSTATLIEESGYNADAEMQRNDQENAKAAATFGTPVQPGQPVQPSTPPPTQPAQAPTQPMHPAMPSSAMASQH